MKGKKKSKFQNAQDETQAAINKTNQTIEELGKYTSGLYSTLASIQELFDKIRNVPSDKKLQYEELKLIRLEWRQQVDRIDKDYKEAKIKNAGIGVAGASLGVTVVTMGPTVAMGVATTFGVASTGTAISTLSGVAATNAALAWLGGGALAAGGGGMAAGQALLALAGPVGWGVAGMSFVASGLLFWKSCKDKKELENLFEKISKRDKKIYDLAVVELKERIDRINNESWLLQEAIKDIQSFGLNYENMTEQQQYTLGSYVNLMSSSTQLLINPIKGLMPRFSVDDFDCFVIWKDKKTKNSIYDTYKNVIVSLSNLLYKIDLDDSSKILLWKSLRKNKKLLESMEISRKDFNIELIDAVLEALSFKYKK